jgi:hypothetical protein
MPPAQARARPSSTATDPIPMRGRTSGWVPRLERRGRCPTRRVRPRGRSPTRQRRRRGGILPLRVPTKRRRGAAAGQPDAAEAGAEVAVAAANHPPWARRDGHVAGQPPPKNPQECAVLLAVTEPVTPKAPGGVGASPGVVRIAEAVEAQAVEIRRDRRGWRRRRTRSLPLAGDNLLPRTPAVIPHRTVLHHWHRGNDNDRSLLLPIMMSKSNLDPERIRVSIINFLIYLLFQPN